MKRLHTITLGISAAALGIGGIAYAQGDMHHGGHGGGHAMKMLDTDGDGVITRAEAQAGAATMFAKLDVNKDGKLDQTDREKARALRQDEMFKSIDTNNDGSISRGEFAAHHGPDHGPDHGPEGMDGAKPDRMGGRMGGRLGGHGGGMMAMAGMADTNKDGAISQGEFDAAATRHFDMADANHDGKVTTAEQQAAHQAMKAKMKAGMKAKWQADKQAGN